jgi:hypothetical protein
VALFEFVLSCPLLLAAAVLLEAGEGEGAEQEREVVYAVYSRTDPKKDTRPQYIEVGVPHTLSRASNLCPCLQLPALLLGLC